LLAGPVFTVDSIPASALFFVESLCRCHRRRFNFKLRRTIRAIGASRRAAPGPRVGKLPYLLAIRQNSEWIELRIARLTPGEPRYRPSALRPALPSPWPTGELQARPFCKARTTRPKNRPEPAPLPPRRSDQMRLRRLQLVRSPVATVACKHRIDPHRPNA
jgi:hypothetical protein